MFEVIATEAASEDAPEVADASHALEEVWRMEQAWERKDSLRLWDGDPAVVDDYLAAGRVVAAAEAGRLLREMIDASRQGEEILVTAATNAHVDQMQGPIIGERDPGLERRITWHDTGGTVTHRRCRRSGPGADASFRCRQRRPLEPGQYLSIRYTNRLTEADIEPSVGSVGYSYDNALAESVIGLYKTELI